MKKAGILLALALLVIFVFSVINLFKSYGHFSEARQAAPENVAIVAADSVAPMLKARPPLLMGAAKPDPEITELQDGISEKLNQYKASAQSLGGWSVGLNFLITVISGLCSLLTTLSTIRNGTVVKKTATVVAILSFVSTLLGFGLSQLNTAKSDAESKQKKILAFRDEIENLTNEEIDTQIKTLRRRLADDY